MRGVGEQIGGELAVPQAVRYLDRVTNDIENCELVIASPQVETELIEKLYQLPPPRQKNIFFPLFESYQELRPQIELRGYIIRELWLQLKDEQVP